METNQKSPQISVPRLEGVPREDDHHCLQKSLEVYFCLLQKHTDIGLSDIPSEIQTYLLYNQCQNNAYTEKNDDQNNDDKVKKPTLSSHSISMKYCNIIVYIPVTNNKVKATLIVLSGTQL